MSFGRFYRPVACTGAIGLLLGCVSIVHADTAIETETAQLGTKGEGNFSQAYEYESAKDGSSQGTVTQFEYALSDRAELLVEPFFYVKESPDGEPSESGLGDLEITPSYMVIQEDHWIPAVVLATKVKVPTGAKRVGGTGNYDYFPYLIFGQSTQNWIFTATLGVNFAQPEEGGKYDRTTVWDMEAQREVMPKLTMFIEAYNSEEDIPTVSTAAEYQFTGAFNAFIAYGRTNEQSNISRIGFNIGFGGESGTTHGAMAFPKP